MQFTQVPNPSTQVNGEALGQQLLAFLNNNMLLRKRLRAPPLTWAA